MATLCDIPLLLLEDFNRTCVPLLLHKEGGSSLGFSSGGLVADVDVTGEGLGADLVTLDLSLAVESL